MYHVGKEPHFHLTILNWQLSLNLERCSQPENSSASPVSASCSAGITVQPQCRHSQHSTWCWNSNSACHIRTAGALTNQAISPATIAPTYDSLFIIAVYMFCVYTVYLCVLTPMTPAHGGERTTFGSHFSPSVMWVLGFKLLLAGLYGKLSTCPRPLCWAISQVLEWIFNHCPSLNPSTTTKEASVNVDGTFREFDLKKTSHREHLSPTTHLYKTKRQWGLYSSLSLTMNGHYI